MLEVSFVNLGLQKTKMKDLNVVLLSLLTLISSTQCAKILGVFPPPAPSHYILGNALMKGLAEKGHDVTIISPFVEKNPPKNGSFKEIVLTGFQEKREERRKEMKMFDIGQSNMFLFLPFIISMMYEMSEQTLNHPNVQTLLKSEEKFDVVIVEQFMNDAHKGFATHFDAPLILLSTIGANTWVNMVVGNPAPWSYVPEVFLSYSSHMTFCERTINTLMHVVSHLLYNFYAFPKQKALFNEHFPTSPPFYDVLYNASIVLLNSHTSINQPVPYVPNMIDIGGYHVQPTNKLPKDLQEFLDNAKEGVIYFSMGSNLRSAEFPPEKRDAFLETFSKLKQKVLWKWEEDVLPGQPPNVKLGKWLPQQEILAHPNVKLFITHGGLLSTTETIYHGVPVLAIPIGADQKLNAQQIVNQGFGVLLNYKDISEKALTERLRELLDNPKYAENAKKRSELHHDRLVKPMDTATYWVEYVIRHRGSPHLRVAGVDLPWYKYMLVDVVAFISVAVLFGVYVFCKIIKLIVSSCSGSKERKVKQN